MNIDPNDVQPARRISAQWPDDYRKKSDATDLVSVIVICYNHARFVVQCLESVRVQTFPQVQLIIIDDCSQDGSASLIRSWIEQTGTPCTFIAHEKNRGVVPTFNEALDLSTGKYIAMVAADDVWMPIRLEAHVSAFHSLRDEYGVVYSDARVISEDGVTVAQSFIDSYRPGNKRPQGNILKDLLSGNFLPAMCTTIRRGCLNLVGKYDESLAYEDYDMWLRLAACYRFKYLDEIVSEYRIVASSLYQSLTSDAEKRKMMAISEYRMVEKALWNNRLSKEERQIGIERLRHLAEQVYNVECANASEILLETLRRTRSLRLIVFFIAARLGIRRSTLTKLKRTVF